MLITKTAYDALTKRAKINSEASKKSFWKKCFSKCFDLDDEEEDANLEVYFH